NKKNNTVKGRFTPIPPTGAIEYFDPRVMRGWQNLTVSFEPRVGSIDELTFLFGCPTTHTHQRVLEAPGPKGSKRVVTKPAGDPAFEYLVPAPSPGNLAAEHTQSPDRRRVWLQLACCLSGRAPQGLDDECALL